MSNSLHAFEFLAEKTRPQAHLTMLVGDESFLQRLVGLALKSDLEDSLSQLVGKTAEWRDVIDELSTMSLFGSGPRVVAIQPADDFVKNFRSQIEDFCEAGSNGRLILEVKSLPSNTRLYKSLVKKGLLINCGLPSKARSKNVDEGLVKKWLKDWAKSTHGLKVDMKAIDAIVDLVGLELGLLDQELAKLALFAEPGKLIDIDLINRVVGGWRQKTTWDMLDSATSGDAAAALFQLDRLLQSGEHPTALFGSISWSLRRFAATARVVQRQERMGQRVNLPNAALEGGFRQYPPAAFEASLKHLKQLGRDRAGQIYRWLLETDLALKGSHSSPPKARLAIEKLIFRMARKK